ncbi:MAG: hypothetical protein ACO1NZ_13385 [Adhaeribacter sp.]
MKIWNYPKLLLLLCLSLGLAPFFPEPHIWGKLKWVAGGAVGMQAPDWFDLAFHGFPWLLLVASLLSRLLAKKQDRQPG